MTMKIRTPLRDWKPRRSKGWETQEHEPKPKRKRHSVDPVFRDEILEGSLEYFEAHSHPRTAGADLELRGDSEEDSGPTT